MNDENNYFWGGVLTGFVAAFVCLTVVVGAKVIHEARALKAAAARISHEDWQDTAIRALLNDGLKYERRHEAVDDRLVTQHINLQKLWNEHNLLDQRVQKLETPKPQWMPEVSVTNGWWISWPLTNICVSVRGEARQ